MNRVYALVAAGAIILALLVFYYLSTSKPSSLIKVGSIYSQSFCMNGVSNTTAMNMAISNGITCFRTDIAFGKSEIGLISNESKEGADYLGIIDYETVGAQPSRNGCSSGCNWTLDTWNASVANAIAAYPQIHEWEIYNEPLVGIFASGYDNGSALNYFNMIKSAYKIIKAKQPNSTIVCFGGAQLFPLSSVQIEYAFDRQVWSYGAANYCDAISLHVYTLPYLGLNQTTSDGYTVEQELNATLNAYENMTHKPVWITETGIPSSDGQEGSGLSEQLQGTFVTQDLNFFTSYPFVKRVYWFNLVGGEGGGNDFGILNTTTLAPKPAWYSFLYFSRNSTQK